MLFRSLVRFPVYPDVVTRDRNSQSDSEVRGSKKKKKKKNGLSNDFLVEWSTQVAKLVSEDDDNLVCTGFHSILKFSNSRHSFMFTLTTAVARVSPRLKRSFYRGGSRLIGWFPGPHKSLRWSSTLSQCRCTSS